MKTITKESLIKILENNFKSGMINKDFEAFKRTHPTLFGVIIKSMSEASMMQSNIINKDAREVGFEFEIFGQKVLLNRFYRKKEIEIPNVGTICIHADVDKSQWFIYDVIRVHFYNKFGSDILSAEVSYLLDKLENHKEDFYTALLKLFFVDYAHASTAAAFIILNENTIVPPKKAP